MRGRRLSIDLTRVARPAAAAALLMLAGCAIEPNERSTAGELDRWVADVAAPAVLRWRAASLPASPVIVSPVPIDASGTPPSELEYTAAVALAARLRATGFAAVAADPNSPVTTDDRSCALGEPARSQITLDITPLDPRTPGLAAVTIQMQPGSGSDPATQLTSTLTLADREVSLLGTTRSGAGAPATLGQPYSADQIDRMLAGLTRSVRCDLMRARWRMGSAQLAWDNGQPAPWLRSVGQRLRDELVRLDVVNGAPGSSRTVERIELRAEPTPDPQVYRIVVRALINSDAASSTGPSVWAQSYYRAPVSRPGPDAATSLASTPGPVTHTAPPASPPDGLSASNWHSPAATGRPRSLPADSVPHVAPPATVGDASIGAFQPIQVGTGTDCNSSPSGPTGTLHTGDCLVFEFSDVEADRIFLLHQDRENRLTRIAPAACLSTPPRSEWMHRFEIPADRARSPRIQLTPPAGTERFLAIAIRAGSDPAVSDLLDSLPDNCGDQPPGAQSERSAVLLEALARESRQGRAAVRTIALEHIESVALR